MADPEIPALGIGTGRRHLQLMSRTSPREQRLRLFRRGNDRCPICLTPFTEAEVEQGDAARLEHVPPIGFRAGGIAMCLTCRPCNENAGRVEQTVSEARRHEQKIRLTVPGLPVQTAYISPGEGKTDLKLRFPKTQVSPDVLSRALNTREFSIAWRYPQNHYADVPWLKAAYLSVVSLLGPLGYRYAEGAAVEPVRRQIMQPEEEIIRHFTVSALTGPTVKDGIAMNRKRVPCWVVKLCDRVVFLPRSWDQTFYEWTDELAASASASGQVTFTIGGGPLWYLGKFGRRRSAILAFAEGYDAREALGEDLFGKTGRVTRGDQVVPFIVADYSGQEVSVLITEGPWDD
ncbi:MAG: hypothetical protein OXH52_08995 [Gammaproteobacteria bacterium]|nr:hypothetical protein [Gammaproteobacteria bacterium]